MSDVEKLQQMDPKVSDIEKLQQMDPEEIYKRTYIAPKMIQALLEEDFKRIGNKSKALGFVKILERELGLELGELRQKIIDYYENGKNHSFKPKGNKESQAGQSALWGYLLIVGLIVVVGGVAGYVYVHRLYPDIFHLGGSLAQNSSSSSSFTTSSSVRVAESSIQNSSFSSSSSSLALALASKSSEVNPSDQSEENQSVKSPLFHEEAKEQEADLAPQIEQNQKVKLAQSDQSDQNEEPAAPAFPKITIVPRGKLWIGIIYLENRKRESRIISAPFELNTSKDQLIVTGHGKLNIDIDGKITKYNDRHKLRFLYRAGELEPIDAATFKQYNKGKTW